MVEGPRCCSFACHMRCCQLDEDCEAKETAFDCLADLSEWVDAFFQLFGAFEL